MRIGSAGDVPRADLATVRRLVPALWAEWAGLEFTADGWLRDPDTAEPLVVLRLVDGRHRVPGARYTLGRGEQRADFVLAFDDGRTVRGTLSGQWWRADLEIGNRLSAAGTADVGAALRASDVPGLLVPLIGGREASGNVLIDPAVLDRGGELVRGRARAQRCAGDLVVGVKAAREVWHGRVTVHVAGRGVLGRSALLAFRSKVRQGVQGGLDEFFVDTAQEAAKLAAGLRELDAQIHTAGGEQALVHRYLWLGVRELAQPSEAARSVPTGVNAATAGASAAGTETPAGPIRLRRGPFGVRRLERPAQFRLPANAATYLVDHGSIMQTGELVVRTGHDRLTAHWPSAARYDTPPSFRGRVERHATGLTISGTIRETRSARTWSLGWGFVTVLMTLVAIFGIYGVVDGADKAYLPLLIGALAAPLFALFWRGACKERRPNFTRQSDELEAGLHRWFASGDARRTFW